jgi:hypothetical protein
MGALSQSFKFVPSANVGNTATTAVVYPNNTNTTQVYVSNPLQGDGYFSGADGLHTIQYVMSDDFIGTVTMQATLATAPTSTDWFNVIDTTSQYTVLTNNNASGITTNMVDTYNFTGNFVWVQCVVTIDHGSVFLVQYNH